MKIQKFVECYSFLLFWGVFLCFVLFFWMDEVFKTKETSMTFPTAYNYHTITNYADTFIWRDLLFTVG